MIATKLCSSIAMLVALISVSNAQRPPETSPPKVPIINPGGHLRSPETRKCHVADLTGTPLNVRNAPAGKVVASLPNGSVVEAFDTAPDKVGKDWTRIEFKSIRGWVLKAHLACN